MAVTGVTSVPWLMFRQQSVAVREDEHHSSVFLSSPFLSRFLRAPTIVLAYVHFSQQQMAVKRVFDFKELLCGWQS